MSHCAKQPATASSRIYQAKNAEVEFISCLHDLDCAYYDTYMRWHEQHSRRRGPAVRPSIKPSYSDTVIGNGSGTGFKAVRQVKMQWSPKATQVTGIFVTRLDPNTTNTGTHKRRNWRSCAPREAENKVSGLQFILHSCR